MAERVEPAWHFLQMFEFLVILSPELVIHLFKSLFRVYVSGIVSTFTVSFLFLQVMGLRGKENIWTRKMHLYPFFSQ